MRTFVVVAPDPVVSWAEIDAHLRLDGDVSEQALIQGWIAAATATIDGPTGWLGRAIGAQTLEVRLDSFECGSISLPYPPIIDIVSVKYLDPARVEQTIAPADYELLGESLQPIADVWPSPARRAEAVRIRYRAGYEVGGTNDAPAFPGALQAIKAAIMLMVGDLFRFRETANTGTMSAVPMSTTVEDLLTPFRVYR